MPRERTFTPVVTSVPAQEQPYRPSSPADPDSEARALRGGVYLTGPGVGQALSSDAVVIGRDPSCQVVVDDPLVSREHALIKIRSDQVLVEDCRSKNGLYVNNVRIFEPRQLRDGDRLLMGTTELCVSRVEPSANDSVVQRSGPPASSGAPESESAVSTQPAATLELLGHLADQMLAEDRPEQAEQVLANHLETLLGGARVGLPVPAETCTEASRRSLMLAQVLWSGKWVNYAVELHLRAEHPMSPGILDQLEEAMDLALGVDHALFSAYVEWLRDACEHLPPGCRQVLDRLDSIELPSARRDSQ